MPWGAVVDKKGRFCLLKPGGLQVARARREDCLLPHSYSVVWVMKRAEGPWGQRDGLLTYLLGHGSVVISWGFCNKWSHVEWLRTTQSHSAVREARSRNSVLGGPYSLPELPVSVHPCPRGSRHPGFAAEFPQSLSLGLHSRLLWVSTL